MVGVVWPKTNIVQNESEQEGGVVDCTVNVKTSRGTNDRRKEIRSSIHLGKREHVYVHDNEIERAEVTPTDDDVVVTSCENLRRHVLILNQSVHRMPPQLRKG